MFTQLSLFDLFEQPAPAVSVMSGNRIADQQPQTLAAAATAPATQALEPIRIYGEHGRQDSLQPLGDLAKLVLVRYEMMARRREAMMQRKAQAARKPIRVLS